MKRKEQQALEILNIKDLKFLAIKTGFREEKLYQWKKTKKLPSMKAVKIILEAA